MHCPRCGQKQISREVKFCSQCGFRLPIVARLLENDGTLPEIAESSKSGIFTRRNGIFFTILWLIFWLIMLPAFFGILNAEFLVAASAVFGLFSSVMLLVISIAFLPPNGRSMEYAKSKLPTQLELPHKQAGEGALVANAQESGADLAAFSRHRRGPFRPTEPSSITEMTTKLLKNQD
ncbi:MAG: hypothetical protein C4324_06045 [Blastocatellia bacterium]